jgi:DHA1 family multidrug resistance protein-like MFS transporter
MQQGLGLFGGSLADRFGAKPLIVCGMLMRAAGFACMALAHSPWLLYLSCLLSGLGGTLFDPPRTALVAKLVLARQRPHFYAILMMQDSAGAGRSVAGLLALTVRLPLGWPGRYGHVCAGRAGQCPAAAPYRVASGKSSPWQSMRVVLQDRSYMRFVLTLSGYYMLAVQVMLLVPVTIKQLTGSYQAVGWMYTLETCLSLSLLYPLARWGERHLRREQRMLIGLGLMSLSLAIMSNVAHPLAAFSVLGLFFLGSIIMEPARKPMLPAWPARRPVPVIWAAAGSGWHWGALGYVGGGWLLDISRQWQWPALPWLCLSLVGQYLLALWCNCCALPQRHPVHATVPEKQNPPIGGILFEAVGMLTGQVSVPGNPGTSSA